MPAKYTTKPYNGSGSFFFRIPTGDYEQQGTVVKSKDYGANTGAVHGDIRKKHRKTLQIQVVRGFLAAGIPLAAMDNPLMRQFFQHEGVQLPSSSHLAQHVPLILEREASRFTTNQH